MHRLHVVIVLTALLAAASIDAQTLSTDQIERTAEVLGIKAQLDSLPAGQTISLRATDGQLVCIRTSPAQAVEHIGIPLFSADLRQMMPSPVYDFMEYALLNWKYKINPNTLYLSKVIFKKGGWQSLLQNKLDECECAIDNRDNKLYVISWLHNGTEVAEVGVPVDYELLYNNSRRNIEKNFVKRLADFQPAITVRRHEPVNEADLKIYGTEGLFVIQGQSHVLDELNQNVYYVLKTVYEQTDTIISDELVSMTLEGVIPAIVIDPEHPAETFANYMLSEEDSVPDVIMALDFHLSNYKRPKLKIPLSRLKEFFFQEGCSLYFASSGITRDTARGMLFVTNPGKGYNHLLSLRMPLSDLASKEPEVHAAVYLYIPPIDKSKLYGKTPTKKSGAQIYNK